jgi:hypothetical protein
LDESLRLTDISKEKDEIIARLTRDIEVKQAHLKSKDSLISHLSKENRECGAKLESQFQLIQ